LQKLGADAVGNHWAFTSPEGLVIATHIAVTNVDDKTAHVSRV
jgi:hypothetical protein